VASTTTYQMYKIRNERIKTQTGTPSFLFGGRTIGSYSTSTSWGRENSRWKPHADVAEDGIDGIVPQHSFQNADVSASLKEERAAFR